MPKAIVTPEKIERLVVGIPTKLLALTEQANASGSYFWCDCRVRYKQEYDTDVDKGIRGKAKASSPVATAAGVSASADADGGATFTKSRDGVIDIDELFEFRSKIALLERASENNPSLDALNDGDG